MGADVPGHTSSVPSPADRTAYYTAQSAPTATRSAFKNCLSIYHENQSALGRTDQSGGAASALASLTFTQFLTVTYRVQQHSR